MQQGFGEWETVYSCSKTGLADSGRKVCVMLLFELEMETSDEEEWGIPGNKEQHD